jgi:phage/plasmid-like protein (TIGR03299 family)
MADAVETMAYFGATPWHGLGEKIPEDKIYDMEAGIKASGLGWGVHDESLQTITGLDVPNRAIVRDTDSKVLGVVGPNYTPLQNAEMFEFFQDWLNAKVCHLHTAGSLHGGEKIWVLCGINSPDMEVVAGDMVSKFILLSNSHDGKNAVRVGFTPIRVVCANTLKLAHGDKASKLIRVRHSKEVKNNVAKIREIMDVANQQFEATLEQYCYLASRQAKMGDLEKYVKIVFGYDDKSEDDLSTKAKNVIRRIIETVDSGVGQDKARGSWWWAYNGVNNYMNYKDGRNSDNVLGKLWFGTNSEINTKALEVATKMAMGKVEVVPTPVAGYLN